MSFSLPSSSPWMKLSPEEGRRGGAGGGAATVVEAGSAAVRPEVAPGSRLPPVPGKEVNAVRSRWRTRGGVNSLF